MEQKQAGCLDSACGHQFTSSIQSNFSWIECPQCGSKAHLLQNNHLEYMRSLQEGWDGYGGMPPSEETIQRAELFLSNIGQFQPQKIKPSCAGGKSFGAVCMTWRAGQRRAYLEMYDHGGDGLLLAIDGKCHAEDVTGKTPQQVVAIVQCYLYGH